MAIATDSLKGVGLKVRRKMKLIKPMADSNIQLSGGEIYQKTGNNIQKMMKGQSAAIRKLLAAFTSGGYISLEDSPRTGKTTLAKALAFSVDVSFKRI